MLHPRVARLALYICMLFGFSYVSLYLYRCLTPPIWETLRPKVTGTLLLPPARLSRFVRQMGWVGKPYRVAQKPTYGCTQHPIPRPHSTPTLSLGLTPRPSYPWASPHPHAGVVHLSWQGQRWCLAP